MKILLITLLKIFILPFTSACLLGTAAIQVLFFNDGDWTDWYDYNEGMLRLLPWK